MGLSVRVLLCTRSSLLLSAALALVGCSSDPAPEGPTPAETAWKTAFDASSFGWLLSVWGPSGDDLYAVGGAPEEGKAMRFDGASWSPVALPPGTPLLNWAFGFGGDDITFVGARGTVLHYDGAAFEVQSTPTDQNLWGVWGASPDDLWAVGGDGREAGQATLLHYDGSAWTEAPVPALQKANVFAFYKVWGTSADNVVVVGQRGVVLRYDGATWTEELAGASDDLISLWGTGPDRIVAVGGRNNGIVSRYDGESWHTQSLSPMRGLNGITMRDPGVVHVVGVVGTIAKLDGDTLEVLEETPWPTSMDLHGVFTDDAGRLTAVGGTLVSSEPPYQGIALTRMLAEGE